MLQHGPEGDSVKLDPVIYATFDQAIDRDAVMAAMRVRQGGADVKLRLATEDEIEADDTVAELASARKGIGPFDRDDGAAKARLLAMKPTTPFRVGADIQVKFPPGTPSAEGPKKTVDLQRFSFRTYGPLRPAGEYLDKDNPFSAIRVDFTNELDLSKFDKAWVTVTPPIPDMKTTVSYRDVQISGRKKGRTKYTVTIAKALTDVFGQTLEQDYRHVFEVGSMEAALFSEDEAMIVLDPAAAEPTLPVFSINDPGLRVRLYAVKPEDYPAYEAWRNSQPEGWHARVKDKPAPVPGKLVLDTVVRPERKPDELVGTKVSLAAALKGTWGRCSRSLRPPGHPKLALRGASIGNERSGFASGCK
jgi:hypothetical protein